MGSRGRGPREENSHEALCDRRQKNLHRRRLPVQELVPQPNPPAERDTHKIIMNVFGKRYELTRHTEVRLI